jgi:hypothetical protein
MIIATFPAFLITSIVASFSKNLAAIIWKVLVVNSFGDFAFRKASTLYRTPALHEQRNCSCKLLR